ncbi:hypothetical protein BS78_K260300 [Paspalum vaginatum]|uniref:non-specific serine/threonine protein kinase n=1 Tax=Paspalum vaginatum TaxID=158149 RepID=A0A9W8CEZ1_9POAL|nr:hypothetical protein BS78_K260300 [Paspalum vaginatum]
MADPLASVEKIVKIGLMIKHAVDTVRKNMEVCQEIRKRVLRFSDILSQLQQTGMLSSNPAMSGALEDLEDTLERALELVTSCQERRSTIRRFITAGDLAKQLRAVKDDIQNKVMLASFAINTSTTIMLFTIHAGIRPDLPRQPEESGLMEISHGNHSAEDIRSEQNGEENNIPGGCEALLTPLAEPRLDWSSLFCIIEGIAQGVSYLHEQRVVHLDLKPTNIVLDSHMNPKITDFEVAKVLNGNHMKGEIITAGTFQYIAPEYLTDGVVSMMNDVYAFGVTLLETVSGIRRRHNQPRESHLHQWAWKALEGGWKEFDPALFANTQLVEIKRCIKLGLLCAQHELADRPAMADVLLMLNGDKELPTPKKPAYIKSTA